MCLVGPARIERLEGDVGWAVVDGQELARSPVAVEAQAVGDSALYHAGLARSRLESDEAVETLARLDELAWLGAAEQPLAPTGQPGQRPNR